MQCLGVPALERDTIYKAVAMAGQNSFDADRAAGPQKFMA
jgi:hypothetical protein